MDTPVDNLIQELDEIYSRIDVLLKTDKFDVIDSLFETSLLLELSNDPDRGTNTALALLISTYNCRDQFKHRASFLQKLRDFYILHEKDADNILRGL